MRDASSAAPGIDLKCSEIQHLSHAHVDKEAMIQPPRLPQRALPGASTAL